VSGVRVVPLENEFGAAISGIDLRADLTDDLIAELRQLWLAHQFLFFPDQPIQHHELERFTTCFGDYGNDPYVKSVTGHRHILEVRREANEPVAPFGASWHSDWSFQSNPPSATILHAKVIPPAGGDTLFADGFRAYEALDRGFAKELEQLTAVHSARRPYSHEGFQRSGGAKRSMTILPSDSAWETQNHPVIRTHPESGRKALWVNPVYTITIKDLPDNEAHDLLSRLFTHALSKEFVHAHKWAENMLTMWDNRSVQHCAQGGYDGHLRVMHRTTVAGTVPA